MTAKEKYAFLIALRNRLADLTGEIKSEIEADDDSEVDFDQLDEHAKDCVFMVEDMMNAVEV